MANAKKFNTGEIAVTRPKKLFVSVDFNNDDSVAYGPITLHVVEEDTENVSVFIEQSGGSGGDLDTIHVAPGQINDLITRLTELKKFLADPEIGQEWVYRDDDRYGSEIWKIVGVGCMHGKAFEDDYGVYVAVVSNDDGDGVGGAYSKMYPLVDFKKLFRLLLATD